MAANASKVRYSSGQREAGSDRYAADRTVKRLALRAGVTKRITAQLAPLAHHGRSRCRVPLRDVQEAASHSDPRTTMRYDRGRGSLDRHATYIVVAFLAGPRGKRRIPRK